jgi:hypothetical protein
MVLDVVFWVCQAGVMRYAAIALILFSIDCARRRSVVRPSSSEWSCELTLEVFYREEDVPWPFILGEPIESKRPKIRDAVDDLKEQACDIGARAILIEGREQRAEENRKRRVGQALGAGMQAYGNALNDEQRPIIVQNNAPSYDVVTITSAYTIRRSRSAAPNP